MKLCYILFFWFKLLFSFLSNVNYHWSLKTGYRADYLCNGFRTVTIISKHCPTYASTTPQRTTTRTTKRPAKIKNVRRNFFCKVDPRLEAFPVSFFDVLAT